MLDNPFERPYCFSCDSISPMALVEVTNKVLYNFECISCGETYQLHPEDVELHNEGHTIKNSRRPR